MEIECLCKNKGEVKLLKVDAKLLNVEDAREFIFNYFVIKWCDFVGMDEFMCVKFLVLSDMDLFVVFVECIMDIVY